MEKICKTYDLEDVAIHSLLTRISISARDKNGNFASRQISVNPGAINLDKFKDLNLFSHQVYDTKPEPQHLLGFVICSSFTHYLKRIEVKKFFSLKKANKIVKEKAKVK